MEGEDDLTMGPAEPPHAWIRALAAWLLLCVALGMYGVVALAPRLLSYARLQQQSQTHQLRLVAIEEQVRRLDRIAEALESDPEFAAAYARQTFAVVRPGEQRIPVPAELSLELAADSTELDLPPPEMPWYTSLIERIALNQRLSTILLSIAAVLAITSFVWPAVAESEPVAADHGSWWKTATRRYHSR